ncbi:hypothetical protein BH23GEM9_BH23GEM9_05140 [soil metagenome]
MDEQEFTQRLVALIESGPDVETFERAALELYVEAGHPEPLAREFVEILVTSGSDQVEMTRRMQAATFRFAQEQLAEKDDAPDGIVAMLGGMQACLERMFQARRLYDEARFTDALAEVEATLAEAGVMIERAPELAELAAAMGPLVATMNGMAGLLHFRLGDFQRAVPLLEGAIAGLDAGGAADDSPAYPKLHLALGAIQAAWGDVDGAIEWTERALEQRERRIARVAAGEQRALLEAEDEDMLAIRDALAVCYAQAGDPRRALAMQGEILAALRKNGKGEGMEAARTAQNAAVSAIAMGDDITAGAFLAVASLLYGNLGHAAHPDAVQCALNQVELHRRSGRYAEAADILVALQGTWQEVSDPDAMTLAGFVFAGALVVAGAGQHDDALELLQQCAELHDHSLLRVFPAAAERQRASFAGLLRHHHYAALSLVVSHFADSPLAVRWLHDLVLRRKGILTDALASQQATALGGRYPESAAALAELATLRYRLAQKYVGGVGDDAPELYRAQLREIERELERVEATLARDVPEAALEQRLLAGDAGQVAGALEPGSVLVELVRFTPIDFTAREALGEQRFADSRYVALVLPAGDAGSPMLVDLGAAAAIDGLVAEWRAEVTSETTPLDGRVPGERLRRLVLDPVLERLPGCTRLYIAPDGDLSTLPFDALPLGEAGYIIDAYRISYLGSGRDALRLGRPAGPAGDAIVFSDPLFDLGQESVAGFEPAHPFEPLPGAREEAEAVGALLGGWIYDGADASERNLEAVASPLVLHLATHGFFLPDPAHEAQPDEEAPLVGSLAMRFDRLAQVPNPMLRSGLALAGANVWSQGGTPQPEVGDGILTAEDVAGLDLLETQLVVLSACETGLGDVHVGEGVYGLRRAFIVAGARTLIMSLWKVPDEETRELMETFYRELLEEGRSRGAALHEAQHALRRRYPDDPFVWGAFICQGEADRGLALEG